MLGALVGLGVLNKLSMLWLGAGIAVGLVATSERRWLATRWPWLAGALALAIAGPYIAWVALHDWAAVEFLRNAAAEKLVKKTPLEFLGEQLLVMNPVQGPLDIVEAEKKFRRVQGWRDIEKLVRALAVFEGKEEATAERVA